MSDAEQLTAKVARILRCDEPDRLREMVERLNA
jgi:hypothetical protein